MPTRFLLKLCAFLAIASGLAFAQAPAPAFEVASIKVSAPPDPAMIAAGKMRIGMQIDKARVNIGFVSLTELIRTAYRVKPHQISGPIWMPVQRFDVVATLPEGASPDQAPEMLQALLAERFKLVAHRESKPQTVYALVVGKGGSKLKESLPDADPPDGEAKDGTAPGAASNQVRVDRTNNGVTVRGGPNGPMKMTMGPAGMHMEASKMTLSAFAEMLTPFLDRPVVDMTEMKGTYQMALDIAMEDMRNVARRAGMPMGAMPGGGAAADPGKAPIEAAPDSSASAIFASIQQLGLKLEPRKESIEMIVIDHLEKNPTEN